MGFSLKNDMDTGVLESNWMAPVPRPVLLIGHSLTSVVINVITAAGMVLVAALLFGFHPTGNALAALLTVIPMLVGLYGFGFAFASIVLLMRDANTLVDISNFLVQIFAGYNFPVNSLPRWLLPISLALPLTYGFDAVRGWLLRTRTLLPISVEILVLLVSMVILIYLGMAVFRRLERTVRMKGTLGQY
jgi:ABC-2 type transport system permease protein